jgi:hypothetical protein
MVIPFGRVFGEWRFIWVFVARTSVCRVPNRRDVLAAFHSALENVRKTRKLVGQVTDLPVW